MRRQPLPDDEPPDPRLSDFAGRKIIVHCRTCGMHRRYDASAMLSKVGDMCLPSLRLKIAAAEGCSRVGNRYYDRCTLAYNVKAMGLGWMAIFHKALAVLLSGDALAFTTLRRG